MRTKGMKAGRLQLIPSPQFTRSWDTEGTVTQSSPPSFIWQTQLGLGQAPC